MRHGGRPSLSGTRASNLKPKQAIFLVPILMPWQLSLRLDGGWRAVCEQVELRAVSAPGTTSGCVKQAATMLGCRFTRSIGGTG